MMHLLNETTREPIENPVLSCLRENAHAAANNASLLLRPDGREIPISDSTAPIHDRERNIIGAVMVFHDVTTERQLTQQLSFQATHDALTGLINRQEFERRLIRVLQSAKEDRTEHALMFLDLDHFKQVNDTSGHAAGDELLRRIAVLFKHAIRQRDTLARLGGDEFGLLLERCTMQQAESIAQELLQHINTFVLDWSGVPHKVGLSIGLAAIDQNSASLSTLLSAADAACYESKRSGRNRYSVYAAAPRL
jgi:diguanylate cyclase (GGDEF)-like protein